MSRGMTKFLLLLLLFIIGVMIGMQIDSPEKVTTSGSDKRLENPSSYIERVENGSPVYVPSHPPITDQKRSDQTDSEKNVAKGWTDSPHGFGEDIKAESGGRKTNHESGKGMGGDQEGEATQPVMRREGGLDGLGKNMGERLTQSAQRILEIAIGLFVKNH